MVHTIKSNQMVDADEIRLSSTEGRRDSWFPCQRNIIMAYEKSPKLPNSAHAIWFRELPFSENGIRSVIRQGAWQRQIQRRGSRAGKDMVIPQLPPIPMFLRRQHRRGQTINLRSIRGRANIPVKTWKDTEPFQQMLSWWGSFECDNSGLIALQWSTKAIILPQGNRSDSTKTMRIRNESSQIRTQVCCFYIYLCSSASKEALPPHAAARASHQEG